MFASSMLTTRLVLLVLPLALAACAPSLPAAEAPSSSAVVAAPKPDVDAQTTAAACTVARDAFENVREGAAVLRIALDDHDVRSRQVLTTWVQAEAPAWAEGLRTTVDGDARLKDEAAAEIDLLAKVHDVTSSARFIGLSEKLDASLERVAAVCKGEWLAAAPKRDTTPARLTAKVIQVMVRSHFGEMRACYERGLARNPKLAGEVRPKFVVSVEGRATGVADAGSTLPDTEVVACVQNAVAQLRFPAPAGGTVTVVYPIIFNPGD